MFFRIILLILSLVIYWQAPLKYDWNICFWCMMLYFLQCYLLLRDDFKNKNYITFNSIFLFSFFWVSFAYPVFIYETVNGYLGVVSQHINWDVLSKVTSLALVFINCYSIGYSKRKTRTYSNLSFNGLQGASVFVRQGLIISFLLIMLNAAYSLHTQGIDNAGVETNLFLFDIFNTFMVLACYSACNKTGANKIGTKVFVKTFWNVLVVTVIFVLVFLVIGDRGPMIRISLIVFYFFSIKTEVSFKKLILVGFAAIFVMFFVRQTRSFEDTSLIRNGISALSLDSNLFNFKESGLIVMFSDLYGIERELCAGYDYVMRFGYVHPEKILIVPTYAIPFLPSIILGLFGMTTDDYSMGAVLNDYLSDYNPHFGNHIVVDLYMCSGIIGVVVFGLLFGVLSGVLYQKRTKNIYYTVCYAVLFSLAVYLPRDSVFSLIRPLSLCIIVTFLIRNQLVLKKE